MKTILQLLLVVCFTFSIAAQNGVSKDKEVISGVVLDEDGNPFPDVTITVKGKKEGVSTDLYGNYTINVPIGEFLVFNFNDYDQKEVKVLSANPIHINMSRIAIKDGDIVTLAMGLNKKKDRIGYSYKEIDNSHLNQANNPNILSSLEGKVSGLIVNPDRTAVMLRGTRSLKSNNAALIVVDGAVSNFVFLDSMDPNLIESVNVIKGANGAALYGSQGSNGVLVVKTKRGTKKTNNKPTYSKSKPKLYRGKLTVEDKFTIPSYVENLSTAESNEVAYALHLEQKDNFKNQASYYIDIYNYFQKQEASGFTVKVLAELLKDEATNYEMLKGLSFQLEANKDYKLASSLYKRLVILKPEVAQSYLDLAGIYIKLDKDQKAFDILNNFLALTTDAVGLNTIVKNNLNSLIQANPDLKIEEMESFNKIKTVFDLRVVASWNRENTNIIMEVVEPSKEYASQENNKTQSGGELNAANNSYGPEEYTIRNAKPGEYFVRLKYNGDFANEDKATFVKLNIYRNYGKKNQKEEVKIIKLGNAIGAQTVARIKM